jgi:mxaD protein
MRRAAKGSEFMKAFLMAGTLLALTCSALAQAEAPQTLKVVKSVTVAAPVDKAWAAVKDFDSLNKWHPGFAKDEIIKGSNNKVGAVRRLTVKDGPTFTEELLAFNEANHSYRYRIIESPLPITDYKSSIAVQPAANGGSRITWRGTFKRKNSSDKPPEAESDAGVKKFVSGVYDGGLDNLKKMLSR